MRIFYASGERPNQALPNSQVWRNNLYLSLVEMGHDVVEFDYDLNPLLRHADISKPANRDFVDVERPRAEAALLAQLAAAHAAAPIDLFFSYFYSVCARPVVIAQIRSMGIKTMNWYCNGSYQFDLVREIAPAYDWCLVPEAFRMEDYRQAGAHPIYCQEAANPTIYHPSPVERDLDIVFVGARYGERPAYIRRLVDAGINVRVFGPGWQRPAPKLHRAPTAASGPAPRGVAAKLALLLTIDGWRRVARRVRRRLGGAAALRARLAAGAAKQTSSASSAMADPNWLPPEVCGPALSDDDMVAMYSRAKISLGFSAVGNMVGGPNRIVQVRLRDFEAPMSGAFYMVEHVAELDDFFEIGREIVCYDGADDLVAKCHYYLAHPEERERIRLAGLVRALRDHTWRKRLGDAFREAGLEGAA